MKKIYFSILLVGGVLQISNAQLSLTKAANEPVVGDVNTKQLYDSTTSVPKATGAGQIWNFVSLTSNPSMETSTYTTVASTPSAAIFPGATISEDQGGGSYQHYKSTPTAFEVQGIQFSGAIVNFSNTGIFFTWPVNFGYVGNDTFAGSTTTGTVTTNITGSVNITASGTGTVVLPGGLTLTNCLQLISGITITLSSGTNTQSLVQREYSYYHSSNKFPVLIAKYQTSTSGTVISKSFDAKVNTAVVVGLTNNQINQGILVYPNPASQMITVSLSNNSNEVVRVSFANMLGQTIKTESLGIETTIHSNLIVKDLQPGIYFMKIDIGKTSSVKRIVIE